MHPILIRVPLPGGKLALYPVLMIAAAIAALFAIAAVVRKNQQGAVLPGLVAAGLAYAGLGPLKETIIEGPLPIYSYGVMLGLSLFVGWFITLPLAERDGLPRDVMADNYVFTALAALAGSRLLYVVTNPSEFDSLASIFAFRKGGLVAYGGFLGGLFGSIFYLRRKGLPLLPWADVAVPSLASGLMITRIGCYLFGCDFGHRLSEAAPAWLKKAGTFPHWSDAVEQGNGAPAWAQQVKAGLLSPDAPAALPVHPTQLYESASGLFLLVLLLGARRTQRFRGQIFLLFFFAYGYLRFLLEIVRDDSERGFVSTSMAPHVLFPLGLAAFGIGYAISFSEWVPNMAIRRATQALGLAAPVALYVAMKPESFAVDAAQTASLSTSQLVALVTGVGACFLFAIYWRAALEHPQQAMAIVLPPEFMDGEAPAPPRAVVADGDDEEPAAGDDDEDDEDDDEDEPAPKPKAAPKPAEDGDGDENEDAKEDAKDEEADDAKDEEADEAPAPPKRTKPAERRVPKRRKR